LEALAVMSLLYAQVHTEHQTSFMYRLRRCLSGQAKARRRARELKGAYAPVHTW
jgi:hypothetical protein